MILLTGASGFVGSNLLRELLKKSLETRCLLRRRFAQSALRMAKSEGVEVVQGDVTDRASIINALKDGRIDGIVHLVGILVETGKQTFKTIHVEGTRNMVEACKEKGIRRYIHMSALGTRDGARSLYHKTKWEAEEIVRRSGLEYTIFRPSVLFGREDRFTNLFAGIMKKSPFVVIPGNGRNRMQPVFIDDLVMAMAVAVKDRGHERKTYEIGGSAELTFDEVIDSIARVIGRRRLKVHVPMSIMRPVAAVAEILLSVPPISRDQLTMLEEDNITGDNALTEVFGIRPKGFEEGMRMYLN
ncbi:MAG: complex I NDUFA9 subunit family protein [Thermodesulfobacteriota bacterium]